MKRIGVFLIVVLAMSVLPTAADIFAPPDYVGDPLSYHAGWEFSVDPGSDLDIPADLESNGGPKTTEFLYDQFPTRIIFGQGDGWRWDPADGDGGMVSDVGGRIEVEVVNWVDQEPEKFIRVQLTYSGEAPVVLGAEGFMDPDVSIGYFEAAPSNLVDANHLYSDIHLHPNPDWESISIRVPSGTILDEVVVDTVSIPEPSAIIMILASAGGLLFVRRNFMI